MQDISCRAQRIRLLHEKVGPNPNMQRVNTEHVSPQLHIDGTCCEYRGSECEHSCGVNLPETLSPENPPFGRDSFLQMREQAGGWSLLQCSGLCELWYTVYLKLLFSEMTVKLNIENTLTVLALVVPLHPATGLPAGMQFCRGFHCNCIFLSREFIPSAASEEWPLEVCMDCS